MVNQFYDRTWVEIDVDALIQNYRILKQKISTAMICCVLKANAYGHSAVDLAKLYESLGAHWFAVSNIHEAIQLRMSGIVTPILILGYTPVQYADILDRYQISQCLYSLDYAQSLSRFAVQKNCSVKVHLKLDTGMGRIGFRCKGDEFDELDQALEALNLPNILTEGVFMHFSVADEKSGEDYSRGQYNKFISGIEYLENMGIQFHIRHCSNSAAIINFPEYQLDMVRAGVFLYGLMPSPSMEQIIGLKPVMSLRSVVSHLKIVHPGESIGYGNEFIATRRMNVATIPIGYADGFWRRNSKVSYSLLVNNKRAPIIGRVCMDQIMIDVSNITCKVGDIVTIFGVNPEHTIDDIARINNTINYEIICSVNTRIPRLFIRDGKIIQVKLIDREKPLEL